MSATAATRRKAAKEVKEAARYLYAATEAELSLVDILGLTRNLARIVWEIEMRASEDEQPADWVLLRRFSCHLLTDTLLTVMVLEHAVADPGATIIGVSTRAEEALTAARHLAIGFLDWPAREIGYTDEELAHA